VGLVQVRSIGQTRKLDKDAFHIVYSVNSASGKWARPRVIAIDSFLRFSEVGDGGASTSVGVAGLDLGVFEGLDEGCIDSVGTTDCEGIEVRGLLLGLEACFACFGARGTISRSSSELYEVIAALMASLRANGVLVRGRSTLFAYSRDMVRERGQVKREG